MRNSASDSDNLPVFHSTPKIVMAGPFAAARTLRSTINRLTTARAARTPTRPCLQGVCKPSGPFPAQRLGSDLAVSTDLQDVPASGRVTKGRRQR